MPKSGCVKEEKTGCTDPVSLRLVRRLATAEKTNPEELSSYDQKIDFEALDDLFMDSSSELMVCFELEGYDVEITSNETIELDKRR